MNMPTFTAEASLYATGRRYRTASAPQWGPSGVVPQLPIGFCMANCDGIGDPLMNAVCKFGCMEGGSGGGPVGGPSDPGCRPGCGPCRNRRKTCINRDCDEREVRC